MTDARAKHPVDDTDHLLAVVFERFAMTGEWPLVAQLRHDLDKADDDMDVMAVGRELDPNLGTVGLSHGDRASLTIHGIARCPGSGEVLEDLLQTMRLAYERFRADGTGAAITSDDLRNDLGFTALRVRRVLELMWTLPGIGGGTGASEDSWKREITADITVFRRAQTVQDVIAAAPSRRRPPKPEITPRQSPSEDIRSPASTLVWDSLVDLHPQVVAAAGALFRDGHYAQASFQAFKALEVALRKRSGLDLSGRELAEKALGGPFPTVVVSRHSGRTGADEQEGLRFMFMGVMQGLRNPGGHELDVRDRQEAFEELSAASLLMRWLDTSHINEPTTSAPRTKGQRPTPQSARPRMSRSNPSPRLVVLQELREMSHREARTSAILELDIAALSTSSGVAEELLQDVLVDLLAEGLVEPNAPTFTKAADQGACRITGTGLRALQDLIPEDGEAR